MSCCNGKSGSNYRRMYNITDQPDFEYKHNWTTLWGEQTGGVREPFTIITSKKIKKRKNNPPYWQGVG